MFFGKSMLPLKKLRIIWGSFLVLNDQKRSDSVFSGKKTLRDGKIGARQKSPSNKIFFEKSILPLKILRIVCGSFLVLNGRKRSHSVFFGKKYISRQTNRGPDTDNLGNHMLFELSILPLKSLRIV